MKLCLYILQIRFINASNYIANKNILCVFIILCLFVNITLITYLKNVLVRIVYKFTIHCFINASNYITNKTSLVFLFIVVPLLLVNA